jgi:hypothetical protein
MVKEILKNDKRARNSDSHLYLQVLYQIGQMKGIDVNAMSVPEFMKNSTELGFPPYKTVCRTRRKVQKEHPELAGCKDVKAHRERNEKDYIKYAQKKGI